MYAENAYHSILENYASENRYKRKQRLYIYILVFCSRKTNFNISIVSKMIDIQRHKSSMTVKTMQTNHVPCKLSVFNCITFLKN